MHVRYGVGRQYQCFKLIITSIHLHFSGTVDGTNQLIIKGKFQQKHIENVLKRYISKGSFQINTLFHISLIPRT